MKCEFGLCLVCEKEIGAKCSTCGANRPTRDYTEVALTWSNGSKMQTAVCLDCAKDKVWKADRSKLTKAIWDAWEKTGAHYDGSVTLT